MALVPDTKDWTWVLDRPCPECGFDANRISPSQVPDRVTTAADEWAQILISSPAVASRPDPDVWSPLEYGCHVRDVFRVFDARLELMLTEDDPTFDNWDQDATAVAERYAEADPDAVAAELDEAGRRFADRLAGVAGAQWDRTGRRSDGAEFTVASFSRYLLHDVVHHLWDVTGQQDAVESLVRE